MLCGPPMLAPIMRDMFTQSGANRPLLTPHLGLSSETTIYSAPSCSSGGGTLGISQGSDISDASPPSLCSTAQCWQRDALLKKHYTRALSTVSAWGENEKTFSSWFQEYKQILASLNLLLSQTFILLRDVGEKDGRSQGNRYFADEKPDERFSLSPVIQRCSGFLEGMIFIGLHCTEMYCSFRNWQNIQQQ